MNCKLFLQYSTWSSALCGIFVDLVAIKIEQWSISGANFDTGGRNVVADESPPKPIFAGVFVGSMNEAAVKEEDIARL